MTDSKTETQKAKPPKKGGRKGGTLFPKINLAKALEYSKKLVAKTHTGAQPAKILLPGVFSSATDAGKIRASALKQYGLLEGPAAAYRATQLAKDIDAALEQDSPTLAQRALLNAKVFKQIFDTYHGDSVSKALIEKCARGFDVHPESAEECAQIFIESCLTAKLGVLNGDSLALMKAGEAVREIPPESADGDDAENEYHETEKNLTGGVQSEIAKTPKSVKPLPADETISPRVEKPTVTLSLTVDATSDPDKLEKQLKLLRHYGVI